MVPCITSKELNMSKKTKNTETLTAADLKAARHLGQSMARYDAKDADAARAQGKELKALYANNEPAHIKLVDRAIRADYMAERRKTDNGDTLTVAREWAIAQLDTSPTANRDEIAVTYYNAVGKRLQRVRETVGISLRNRPKSGAAGVAGKAGKAKKSGKAGKAPATPGFTNVHDLAAFLEKANATILAVIKKNAGIASDVRMNKAQQAAYDRAAEFLAEHPAKK